MFKARCQFLIHGNFPYFPVLSPFDYDDPVFEVHIRPLKIEDLPLPHSRMEGHDNDRFEVLLLKMRLANDPWPNFVIPLWAFIAYGIYYFKKSKDMKQIMRGSRFTIEQLNLMKELVDKEIEEIRTRKQEIIDEGAKRGEVISTDKLLASIDELKCSYQGPNPEQYFQEIDTLKKQFREKYGPSIRVDEAYKIVTDFEKKYGSLD